MEAEGKWKGGGGGGGVGDRQRNRQVKAQALLKLPFSNLPLQKCPKKKGLTKLDIGHHQLQSNYTPETWSNHDCH